MNQKIVKLTVELDEFAECPSEYDGWKLYSFNSRHTNFRDPYSFFSHVDRDGTVTTTNIGLKRKLSVGTAFILSCYEHSGSSWGLQGEVFQCQWDTARVAGILVWEQPVKNLGPKTFEDRQQDARNFLKEYTDWANGHCYNVVIEYEDGETENSGGYTGYDNLKKGLKEEFPEIFIEGTLTLREDIEIDGEAKDVLS